MAMELFKNSGRRETESNVEIILKEKLRLVKEKTEFLIESNKRLLEDNKRLSQVHELFKSLLQEVKQEWKKDSDLTELDGSEVISSKASEFEFLGLSELFEFPEDSWQNEVDTFCSKNKQEQMKIETELFGFSEFSDFPEDTWQDEIATLCLNSEQGRTLQWKIIQTLFLFQEIPEKFCQFESDIGKVLYGSGFGFQKQLLFGGIWVLLYWQGWQQRREEFKLRIFFEIRMDRNVVVLFGVKVWKKWVGSLFKSFLIFSNVFLSFSLFFSLIWEVFFYIRV